MITTLRFAVAGLGWGIFAALLGGRAFGDELWGGVILSPFIGAIVGRTMHPAFRRAGRTGRVAIALASLYLAAVLFGAAMGLTAFVDDPGTRVRLYARTIPLVLSVLWGITFTGFLLFLWPAAYGTHWLIEQREG